MMSLNISQMVTLAHIQLPNTSLVICLMKTLTESLILLVTK